MRKQCSPAPRWAARALLMAALLVSQTGSLHAEANPVNAPGILSLDEAVTVEGAPEVVVEAQEVDRSAYPKLESQLASLYESAVLKTGRPPETFAGERYVDLATGMVRVIVDMNVDPQARKAGPATVETVKLDSSQTATIEHAPPIAIRADLAAAIAAAGAAYETAYRNWVQVLAPFGSLAALSKIDGVRVVRLPFPAHTMDLPAQAVAGDAAVQVGTVTTEGVNLTGVGTWHASPNLWDGTGINLAVFDFGFTNWAARQTSLDLPSGTNLVRHDFSSDYRFSPDTTGYDHGTACAEIAYDMAPGSTVHLYAWGTDVEFGNAVTNYQAVTGSKIATMSIGWANAGPYDGTGPVDAIVNTAATTYGIFWANSAGNQQKSHHSWTSALQTGNYTNFGPGTDQYEEYGPSSGSWWNLSSSTITAFLEWNDWNAARNGNVSHIDYNLRLWRSTNSGTTWTNVASSTGNQCSSTAVEPTEAIEFSGASGWYRLTVERYPCAGWPNDFGHWMTLHSWLNPGNNPLWYHTNPCNSLLIPAGADGAVVSGAIDWNNDATSPLYGLEYFSSLGPRNASGGANPGTTVNKPDVVAPDRVSTVTYGTGAFGGTSAASPHTAGLAASLWERYSTYTLAQLRNIVHTWALDRLAGACGGTNALNNSYGEGRISVSSPTSVKLMRFEAWPEASAIHVQWETAEEIDNLGFNLYRANTPTGRKIQLNEELITGNVPPGSPFGAVYDWIETNRLRSGRIYFYWLEDVDIYGNATMHGPVEVRAGPAVRPKP